MPQWDPEELRQAEEIARAIESCPVPKRHPRPAAPVRLRLSDLPELRVGLASTARALPVRALCRAICFDEEHPFRWRLEHKLVQALAINRYLPGHIPVTRGMGRLGRQYGAAGLAQGLKREFPNGLYIKPALGDSSGERPMKDVTCYYLEAVDQRRQPFPQSECITDEDTVVQDRLFIEKEYRIHTLEDRVIEDLTFLRYGNGNIPGERARPNAWLQALLPAFPAAFLGQTLLGWDIAMDAKGRFRIIEMNFTGFHPVHRRGFQCSGYFQDWDWGASMTARLFRFVEKVDGLAIDIELDVDDSPDKMFYSEIARWLKLLRSGEVK